MTAREQTNRDAPDGVLEPPRPRRSLIGAGAGVVIVIAAFALTVGIGVLRSSSGTAMAEPPSSSPSTDGQGQEGDADAGRLYVHVHGGVRRPGLYLLAEGARVVDAVAAAEGLAEDADASAVNLARLLQDGEQVRVPLHGEQPAETGSGDGAGDGVIDLNTADQSALETLPRVGPATARRIVEWRRDHGPFSSVDDLLSVSGIGPKMLETLRDLVRV